MPKDTKHFGKSRMTTDGFNNVYRNLGSNRDITTNTFYTRNPYITLNYQMLNGLYTNWIGGKAVDIPVEDAFKGGRQFNCEDTEALEQYKKYLKKIKLDTKIEMALKWAKIFGTAVIIVISNDDEMQNPLIKENIRLNDVKDLIVMDRWQLYSTEINRNPMSSNYLQPEYYYVSRTSTPIHHSRVFRFDGLDTTLYDKEMMNGWSLSVYERVYKTFQNAQMSPDLLINLLVQSNIDVFGIDGLNDNLSTENDEFVIKRLNAVMTGKSLFNGVTLDKNDTYTNVTKSFGGLGEVHNIFMDLVCGAVDIPKTRFMNIQSTGLANDGTGDLKFYYDRIEANERAVICDAYEYFDDILTRSSLGERLDMTFEFESLFQMTPEQESVIRNRDAQTNAIYLDKGVITELDVKETLANDMLYPSITPESVEAEKEMEVELNQGATNFNEEVQ